MDPEKQIPDGPPPQYQPPEAAQQHHFAPGPSQQYAPQQGYPPPQGYQQAQTTVVVQQQGMPINGAINRYSQFPAYIVCQHCQATVTTAMILEPGLLTWVAAGAICIFGCWLGCCLIPFCVDGAKDVEHRCPNCQNIVGRFRHIN